MPGSPPRTSKIPVQFLHSHDEQLFEPAPYTTPVPDRFSCPVVGTQPPSGLLDVVAGHGTRVVLYGEGADALCFTNGKPLCKIRT